METEAGGTRVWVLRIIYVAWFALLVRLLMLIADAPTAGAGEILGSALGQAVALGLLLAVSWGVVAAVAAAASRPRPDVWAAFLLATAVVAFAGYGKERAADLTAAAAVAAAPTAPAVPAQAYVLTGEPLSPELVALYATWREQNADFMADPLRAGVMDLELLGATKEAAGTGASNSRLLDEAETRAFRRTGWKR